jgi:hypothetical protein
MKQEHSATAALREAFAATLPHPFNADPETRKRLRDAVCAFVDELKADGFMPEAILIQLRAVAARAGLRDVGEELVTEAVRLCLAHYFGD